VSRRNARFISRYTRCGLTGTLWKSRLRVRARLRCAYLRRHGRPHKPQELVRHNVLIYSTVHADDALRYGHAERGRARVQVRGSLRSNSLCALLAAVRDGVGVAALAIYLAASSPKDGKVVQILPDYALPTQEIHAPYPSRRLIGARVTALVEHLAEAFARPDWYAAIG